jgi:hypothetical protein
MRGVERYWHRQPFVSMMQGLANFVAQMLGSLAGAGLVLSTTVCDQCATVVAFCAHRTIASSPFVPCLYSRARQWCKLAAGIR